MSRDDAGATWEALREAQPGWVHALWRTPVRRIGLAVVFLALAMLILLTASGMLSDGPRRAVGVVWAALALLPAFGSVLAEATLDLGRGRNRVPTFFRLDAVLGTPRGRVLALGYLGVVAAVYTALVLADRAGWVTAVIATGVAGAIALSATRR